MRERAAAATDGGVFANRAGPQPRPAELEEFPNPMPLPVF
jgi:hypothetical protein